MQGALKIGALLHKRYKILKVFGGDFGMVYEARDLHASATAPSVALKQMPTQMIVVCERLADLRPHFVHPAIPRIWGYFTTKTHSFLVQEFIEGTDLEKVLVAHAGFLPERKLILWAIQLCDVLDYLHNHPQYPTLFRDLKPNNVIVNPGDQVYLVDFELARTYPPGFFQGITAQFQHYQQGAAIGTMGYAPPEQHQGLVQPQSDLYALGATLHHLLTKRDPRKAQLFSFRQYPVETFNPQASPELTAIVTKALEHDPLQRFASAKEMQAALAKLLQPIPA